MCLPFREAIFLRQLLADQMIDFRVRRPMLECRAAILLLALWLIPQMSQHRSIHRRFGVQRVDRLHLSQHGLGIVVAFRIDVFVGHKQQTADVIRIPFHRRLDRSVRLLGIAGRERLSQSELRVGIRWIVFRRLLEDLSRKREIVLLQSQLAARDVDRRVRRRKLLDDVVRPVEHLFRIASLTEHKPSDNDSAGRVAVPPRSLLHEFRDLVFQLRDSFRLVVEATNVAAPPSQFDAAAEFLERRL